MNKTIGTLVGIATIVVGQVSTADATSAPTAPAAAPCVVDVSDWPLGILPDAGAAFGPADLTACTQAVADWPVGVLPDGLFTGIDPAASPRPSAGALSPAAGGAGAFIPGPAPSTDP